MSRSVCTFTAAALLVIPSSVFGTDKLADQVRSASRKAATYFCTHAASHGGYVYHYTPDLTRRWGEGEATRDQIWVQPPGTPTVGMALLKAWQATDDRYYLDAARRAAEALLHGQLKSGGWTNCVDFNPRGERTAAYRNGRGRGRNTSSLDDGQSSSAIRFLIQTDAALNFQVPAIHEGTRFALRALLAAQFPNGAFPQVWTGPVRPQPIVSASYPDYDWRSDGRIKNYWDMYTLNDNVCGYVTETLIEADQAYGGTQYKAALARLGDFLIRAQMPAPQPGWAQQYNYNMQPIWARRFEPPGVSGDESQEAIRTLMTIAVATQDARYLKPVPAAIGWLRRSALPDGQVARYYELRTNRPVYMSRRGRDYSLTYDDSNLPSHYGWKTRSEVDQLQADYDRLRNHGLKSEPERSVSDRKVREIVAALDAQGRWMSTFSAGDQVIGQLKLPDGARYLSSAVFSRNLETLSRWLLSRKANHPN